MELPGVEVSSTWQSNAPKDPAVGSGGEERTRLSVAKQSRPAPTASTASIYSTAEMATIRSIANSLGNAFQAPWWTPGTFNKEGQMNLVYFI